MLAVRCTEAAIHSCLVASIMDKLGVDFRAIAVTWAVRNGLV